MLCKRLLINKHSGSMLSPKGKSNTADENHNKAIYVSNHKYGKCLSILQHAIDPVVWSCAKELYTKYVMNKKHLQTQIKEKGKLLSKKYSVANNKVSLIQNRIDKVEERIIVGNISEEKSEAILSSLIAEKTEWQRKVDSILYEISINIEDMKSLMENSTVDLDSLPFLEKYDITHKMIEKVLLSKPNPKLRETVAEIYTKVDDSVYIYDIKTKSLKWRLREVSKRTEDENVIREYKK